MRILFCGDTFPAARKALQRKLTSNQDEIVVCPDDNIVGAVNGVDVVIPLMCRIDSALMDKGRFRFIQQWGAGIEGVDLAAAQERGIWVANVPATGSNADSVAEHAILLTIALLRELPVAQANVKLGRLGAPIGHMLAGKTVCLYGLGSIAVALARRLRSFNVRLVGITRDPDAPKVKEFGLDACYSTEDRNACLAQTDILVLCARLSEETRGVIDQDALNALRPGSYLVNAARGALVDYRALYGALGSGHLAGAGLDVYWKEPISPDDPLLTLPNVIATPHIAGVTDQSYDEIAASVAANIDRIRLGEVPLNCIVQGTIPDSFGEFSRKAPASGQ
jgi:phosphoglycerate dehydrogenase-like enzyme